VGLLSEYSCPVLVKIYFPADAEVNQDELISILESETLTYAVAETQKTVELGYKVSSAPVIKNLSKTAYTNILYMPYVAQFNSFAKFDSLSVKTLKVAMGKNAESRNKLNYLVSHLSNDRGVIGFRTYLNEQNNELIAISYVDSMTNAQIVFQSLNSDTLSFNKRDGTKGKIVNIFRFENDTVIPN
jgi:hypothetical protein